MKRIVSILICVVLGVCCPGCGQKEAVDIQEEVNEDVLEIGFTFDSLVIERWERDRDVFVARAKELGAEVNVQNANGDVESQISQIEYFIEKDVDAIVIVATDCDALSEVISKAQKNGIKVVSYDRLISNANTDLYISFDNTMVGEIMGDAIVSQTGGAGEILMINGALTDTNVPAVIEGFEKSINNTEISVLEVDYCEGWKAEYAATYVQEFFNNNPEVVPAAIMCGNDSLAGQVIRVLSEKKLAGTVVVTGQDADLDACQRIVEGTQYMTVYKPVETLAQRAAELTIELATGEGMDVQNTINDGTYDIPYESLTPIEVTAENMDEVIIGTFHQKDEVYLNVEE